VKPLPVEGLDPGLGLAQAARRIVAVRVGELYALAPAALDEHNSTALHELRIAAKRLRYVLELVGFCLDDAAAEASDRVRQLQTLIGEIHDYDVLLARIGNAPDARRKGTQRLTSRLSERRAESFAQFARLWAAIDAGGLHARLLIATNHSPDEPPIGA
jgi:CHAD domain-containing protein